MATVNARQKEKESAAKEAIRAVSKATMQSLSTLVLSLPPDNGAWTSPEKMASKLQYAAATPGLTNEVGDAFRTIAWAVSLGRIRKD